MLIRLSIRNYVLIEELDLDFGPGLTVITGETGAGKSILAGALSLVIGQRADLQTPGNPEKKCVVEGEFNVKGYGLKEIFKRNDLDYDDSTVLRREISPEGKSRAFVNDTPVNLGILRQLGLQLIDIHSQHTALSLTSWNYRLHVIDAFASLEEKVKIYVKHLTEFRALERQLADLCGHERKAVADCDYYRFQLEELDNAALKEGDQELLEAEASTLEHAGQIRGTLQQVTALLNENEGNVVSHLSEAERLTTRMAELHPALFGLKERLTSATLEINDIATELEAQAEKITPDPQRLLLVNERLNLIYRIQQKHRLNTVPELMQLADSFREILNNISSLTAETAETQKQLDAARNHLMSLAQDISHGRSKSLPALEQAVNALLSQMAMPNSHFRIELNSGGKATDVAKPTVTETGNANNLSVDEETFDVHDDIFGPLGIDRVQFFFRPNLGGTYREVAHVASGGELARLTLALKSVIARKTAMPTLLLDEADAGVSGEVADMVGKIIRSMADPSASGNTGGAQVIAITHLPQIAGKGDNHLLAEKTSYRKKTITSIRKLSSSERVDEIARLLSGEKLTEAAIRNARELLLHK